MTVSGPFNVDGWALDRRATTNSGVDAVHVYAYPSTSSTPIFLGAAQMGLTRNDVGMAFGSQFSSSGYHLGGATLAPGTYDIVAFAHSSVSNTFENQQVVRITVQ
jgi:hypothetical protein